MFRYACLALTFAALCGCTVLPEGNGRDTHQQVRQAAPRYASDPGARQCLAELGRTQANFSPLPDRYFDSGCSTRNSVQLSALSGDYGTLSVGGLGPVACPLANSLAAWARYGVDRAARQILGVALVRIETMGSYACRNVAGSGRRSAHATANAIDVSAFILADGRRISVENGWKGGSTAEREFLRVVHASACKRFGTVLGPDYNADHQNHFHLETSGNAYCR